MCLTEIDVENSFISFKNAYHINHFSSHLSVWGYWMYGEVFHLVRKLGCFLPGYGNFGLSRCHPCWRIGFDSFLRRRWCCFPGHPKTLRVQEEHRLAGRELSERGEASHWLKLSYLWWRAFVFRSGSILCCTPLKMFWHQMLCGPYSSSGKSLRIWG